MNVRHKALVIATLVITLLAVWGASLYLAQYWGYHRGVGASEPDSPIASCQVALDQQEMAQLELDEDWRPEPLPTVVSSEGNFVQEMRSDQEVEALRQERRERLEATLDQAESDIDRFCNLLDWKVEV